MTDDYKDPYDISKLINDITEEELNKYMKYDNKTTIAASGIDLLQVAFIVLKLCKVINWSWWWVLSPMWISIVLFIICVTILTFVRK